MIENNCKFFSIVCIFESRVLTYFFIFSETRMWISAYFLAQQLVILLKGDLLFDDGLEFIIKVIDPICDFLDCFGRINSILPIEFWL